VGLKAQLYVYGAGRLGHTLASLWQQAEVLAVASVHNRSRESALAATKFIGAGEARLASELPTIAEAAPHRLMLSVPDGEIAGVATRLAEQLPEATAGSIAFHCSGSLASELLDPLRQRGYAVASLHPVKSFADPALAAASFAGTWCAVEGDSVAVAQLTTLVEAIGGRCFGVDAAAKSVYHAGSVFASNCVVGLMEAARRCFAEAGIEGGVAAEILGSIARGTLANVARLGTTQALTGPIARGEAEVVARQMAALGQSQPVLAEVYRAVGLLLVELSMAQGTARPESLAEIGKILGRRTPEIPG